MRPANILTAVADIMFGFAASGIAIDFLYEKNFWFKINEVASLYWLITSTIGLYGGGVVFNDIFDARLDRKERPERPIPSGKVSMTASAILGSILFLAGVFAAYQVSVISAVIACLVIPLALVYNKYSKHHTIWGPLNMGACRCANLMLGISVVPKAMEQLWFLGLIPILYIGAITLVSKGEVYGADRRTVENGILLYMLMLLGVLNMGIFLDKFKFFQALPFLLLFLLITVPSWVQVLKKREGADIRKTVKTGILSLIALDASLAAGFAGFEFGALVLILLPLSVWIAKKFTVT